MSEAKRQQLIGKAEQTHRLTEAELAALLADDGADEAMAEAARIVEEAKPDFIDINFGCPVKKVAGK